MTLPKVAQNHAGSNDFLNHSMPFIVPFQHVSSQRHRVLIFSPAPLEIKKSRK
jgi:hypothetical protein